MDHEIKDLLEALKALIEAVAKDIKALVAK